MKHLILGLSHATNSTDLIEFVVVTIFSILPIFLLVLLISVWISTDQRWN